MVILGKLLNSFIWPIDETLTGTRTPGQSWPGCNGKKKYLIFLKTPGLEPHHQVQFSVILRKLIEVEWGSYPSEGGTVGVFDNPSRQTDAH